MVKVKIRFVDGGYHEYKENELGFIERLEGLIEQGYEGKELIHILLTDDWGPPPRQVQIIGTSSDGRSVNIIIPYS